MYVRNSLMPGPTSINTDDFDEKYTTEELQEAVLTSHKMEEAVNKLIYSMEYGLVKSKAFEEFSEDVFTAYLQAKQILEERGES